MMDEQRGPERLHAPWRMAYITQAAKSSCGCVFCMVAADTQDRENLVIYRGQELFVILNAFPYNSGHLMVIPYQHTAELADLTPTAQAEMMRLTTLAIEALRRAMRPDGFNLGMNLGRSAGAGIADHLHMHVVPRWTGDTNFVPVIANARVLPESLECTWEKVAATFRAVVEEERARE